MASDRGDHEAWEQQVQAGRDAFVAGRDLFNISLPGPSGKVTATVSAFQESPPRGGWPMNGEVRYEGRLVDGRLLIGPRHPYMDDVSAGAELAPAEDIRSRLGRSRPAELDLKMVNNTAETVVVHHVRLEVAESDYGAWSAPFVQEATASLTPWLEIHGPIGFVPYPPKGRSGVTLSFHLEDPTYSRVLTSQYLWAEYTGYRSLREGEADHPLVLALAEAGAYPVEDEELARQNYERKLDPRSNSVFGDRGEFHGRLWRLGQLSHGQASIVGDVSYVETGIDDVERRYSNPFRALVCLDVEYPSPPILEMRMGFTGRYASDALLPFGQNYTVDIPVSHSLVPGEADRILVGLPVESASTHDFTVKLLSTAGDIDCGQVRLETLKSAGAS
jgi:hypothetical protein